MYLNPLYGQFIEKVLRDPSGRLARVTFYVYEQNGRIKGRIVETVFLEELPKKQVFALKGDVSNPPAPSEKISYVNSVISPFVDSQFLYTSGSKPRAPSFR